MLFNSYAFLFLFAPLCYGGLFWLGSRSSRLAGAWLALASLVFYGCWNPRNLPILITSIVFNYYASLIIDRTGKPGNRKRILAMWIAIAVDLAALSYYKYAGFFLHNLSALHRRGFRARQHRPPLGVAYLTQIAYLVDTEQGKVHERNFINYLLFVTFFPHLIARPYIHHKDVMPQFATRDAYRFHPSNFVIGVIMLVIGLFKKCFIADTVADFARPIFQAVEHATPALLEAWSGALAYTLQIYFDFSGYSDMAIGLSLMLNVRLPFNFNSPYKAGCIIDFWKRWAYAAVHFP